METKTLKEIRAEALGLIESEVAENEQRLAELVDLGKVETFVRDAITRITDLVTRFPERDHQHQMLIGYSNTERGLLLAYVKACNDELKTLGRWDELRADLTSFSNVGDPYFMGKPHERVQYYVRISEGVE